MVLMTNEPEYDHWIEYQAHNGITPCTYQSSSHAGTGYLMPLDNWISSILALIREGHPDATGVVLKRRKNVDRPPEETVRDLRIEP